MFSTKKFGGYLARLRKNADMTQSELSDKLKLTRQAISCYEVGDSFPDVSILIEIAQIFGVTLDQLISAGKPTKGESLILNSIATGKNDVIAKNVTDIMNLAPFLKPSVLANLSQGLSKQGIEISNVVKLAEYLNDEGVVSLLEKTNFGYIDDGLIERLIPILDENSKNIIFQKILDGEMDWHMIKVLLPHAEYMVSLIEAAVVEGVLPWEALAVQREGMLALFNMQRKNGEIE